MVKLGDVASINPRADRLSDGSLVDFVGMADLDAETGSASPRDSRPYSSVKKGYTIFRNRDVLVAKITPCFENVKIGQAFLRQHCGAGSTEFHIVRPSDALVARYLLHFLRQPEIIAAGERRMTGSAGQKRIPKSYLQELEIPVPLVFEQRRIATILDQAAVLRAKRRQVLSRLDNLVQSIFRDMFGDRYINDCVPLGDIAARIDSGSSPVCESRSASSTEWGVLKLGAVTYGVLRPDENKAFLGDTKSMMANEVQRGDVLMTRKNTRDLVGAVALVDEVSRACCYLI